MKKKVKKVVRKKIVKPKIEKNEKGELLAAKLRILFLENRVAEMESMLKGYETLRSVININVSDPSPKDEKERISYVEKVALLHRDILKPKFENMIAATHVLSENPENSRDTDMAIKGTIYALREIIRWGNLMVSEDVANKQEKHDD